MVYYCAIHFSGGSNYEPRHKAVYRSGGAHQETLRFSSRCTGPRREAVGDQYWVLKIFGKAVDQHMDLRICREPGVAPKVRQKRRLWIEGFTMLSV